MDFHERSRFFLKKEAEADFLKQKQKSSERSRSASKEADMATLS